MKSLSLFLVTAFFIGSLQAQQCTLDATVKGIGFKNIQLYLLYGESVPNTPSTFLQPDKNGKIKHSLQLPYPVFALLELDKRRFRLLLSPGRDLQLTIDSAAILFSGKGAPENQLVQSTTVLNSRPFFMDAAREGISVKDLSITGWNDTIMRRVEQELETTKAQIERSNVPATLKKIVTSEVGYAYQCYLTDFTRMDLRQAKKKIADTAQRLVMQWLPLPESSMLQSGFYANMMIDKRSLFDINQATKKKGGNMEAIKGHFGEYMGMPFNAIDSMIRKYGEKTVLGSLYASRHLPASIQDKVYFNLVTEAYDLSNSTACAYLVQAMQEKYPASPYTAQAKSILNKLTDAISKNSANSKIAIEDLGNMRSVLEVIKKYEGKVIYLDVWGTWCGPCKKEMTYVPALKKRYADKNIVFLYIALDNPEQDKQWKDYILTNKLEGKHYRVNRAAGEAFWEEAKVAGVPELSVVPRYMIVDAGGKIVHGVAERPSSQQNLYDQLDKLLN